MSSINPIVEILSQILGDPTGQLQDYQPTLSAILLCRFDYACMISILLEIKLCTRVIKHTS